VVVLEVHPEVSFTALGADTTLAKRTAAGALVRHQALEAARLRLPGVLRGPGFALDDALDACAVAWTARRHARGEARSLPEVPERFSDGLPAAIHV
jgi:predicted RNase H-like nuclease